jgi:hypothetical protein
MIKKFGKRIVFEYDKEQYGILLDKISYWRYTPKRDTYEPVSRISIDHLTFYGEMADKLHQFLNSNAGSNE